MVEQSLQLDLVLKALADPVRRGMLAQLRSGPATVGEMAKPYQMSFAGAAKHITVLERAKLVSKSRRGRSQICTLQSEPLRELERWLSDYTRFWHERLDALVEAIEGNAHD